MLIIPEAKIDKEGLLYIEGHYSNKHNERLIKMNDYTLSNSFFYELVSSPDYILKYSFFSINKDKFFNMLLYLQKIQNRIQDIDFPIGYYMEENKICGEIIKYYKNAPSLNALIKTKDINEISKYYYHDDDSIHNLYLLLTDILNQIEELFENGVYYTDIHPGNFVISDNKVKLIDFDYQYVHFNSIKDLDLLNMILFNYESLVYILNKKLALVDYGLSDPTDFSDAKRLIKKVENDVRKRV